MESHNWLLLGSEDQVANNFTFAESHPISITWDIDPENEKLWDYSIKSFITTHKYNGGTAIVAVGEDMNSDDAWYDLSGRKFSGRPATKGLYVHHGNKFVIK
jgi:hypothetical protein